MLTMTDEDDSVFAAMRAGTGILNNVSSIFVILGVSDRAAAVAQARDAGIRPSSFRAISSRTAGVACLPHNRLTGPARPSGGALPRSSPVSPPTMRAISASSS
jgi:hypothetical protein